MNMDNEERKGARALQKEATAKAVLRAAREEFARVGFEAANLRAIATRAGVSPGTVIHHYGDKRELLHAALFSDLEETLHAALARPGPGPLEAQLSRLAGAVFGYYQGRPALSRALLKESLFADPPWAERFAAQTAEVHEAIGRLAEAAATRGELRPDAERSVLAVAWLSFFYFALIAWVQGGKLDPVALVDRLFQQHIRGLRP